MVTFYLVDDEDMIREGMQFYFPWDQYGAEVVGSAVNGAAALSDILRKAPDVVLTDVVMPKMDGIELARNLRQLGYTGEIIFLSGGFSVQAHPDGGNGRHHPRNGLSGGKKVSASGHAGGRTENCRRLGTFPSGCSLGRLSAGTPRPGPGTACRGGRNLRLLFSSAGPRARTARQRAEGAPPALGKRTARNHLPSWYSAGGEAYRLSDTGPDPGRAGPAGGPGGYPFAEAAAASAPLR